MAILDRVDVIVVGAGNAAMCAALAAREKGAGVLVLESASEAERGGNTRYAAGQMRVGFGQARNLAQVVEGLDREALARSSAGFSITTTRVAADLRPERCSAASRGRAPRNMRSNKNSDEEKP